MEKNVSDKCAIRVQFYDRCKYVILDKKDIGDWDFFIRAGE